MEILAGNLYFVSDSFFSKIHDMFPVTARYIDGQYIKGGQSVRIADSKLIQELEKTLKKIINLLHRRVRFTPAYKNSDVNMVIFETYSSGMAGSGEIKGFLYLEQDFTDNIFEYDYFKVYRSYNYSEITDNWYYFDKSY